MTTQIQKDLVADGSITTAKFDAGAVCPSATNAANATNVTGTGVITSANIADGTITKTDLANPLTQGTAVASTSGTAIDFTSIPSWVKRITILLNGVSTSSTSGMQIQIGSLSGGIETTGYLSQASTFNNTPGGIASLTGLLVTYAMIAANAYSGKIELLNVSGNTWVTSGVIGSNTASVVSLFIGNKTISSTLDRVRITTVNGTDTFDAGSINILYE